MIQEIELKIINETGDRKFMKIKILRRIYDYQKGTTTLIGAEIK
jgi:hypothetical protein